MKYNRGGACSAELGDVQNKADVQKGGPNVLRGHFGTIVTIISVACQSSQSSSGGALQASSLPFVGGVHLEEHDCNIPCVVE